MDKPFWESGTFWAAVAALAAVLGVAGGFFNWVIKVFQRWRAARAKRLESQPVETHLTSDYVTCCIDERAKGLDHLVIRNFDSGPITDIELMIDGVPFAEHSAFHVDDGPNLELLKYGILPDEELRFPFGIETGDPNVTNANISWCRSDGSNAGRKIYFMPCSEAPGRPTRR